MFNFRSLAFAAGLFAAAGTAASAQTYPARPITMVVAYGAGGITDVLARLVSRLLSEETGATVVVENRPGAGGLLGTESAARARPDGYTVLYATGGPFVMQPHMANDPLGYDPFEDFIHVRGGVSGAQIFVANADAPYDDLPQLIAHARANPGQVNFGSPGIGTAQHLATEFLMQAADIEMEHIPYKAGSAQIVDLIAGVIDVSAEYGGVIRPHVEAGKLKVLGTTGSDRRDAFFPDAMTVAEAGYPQASNFGLSWVAVPRGTPPEAVAYLSDALEKVWNRPEWQQYMAENSQQSLGHLTGDALTAHIAGQSENFRRTLVAAGLARP